jgi:hypothetical protein
MRDSGVFRELRTRTCQDLHTDPIRLTCRSGIPVLARSKLRSPEMHRNERSCLPLSAFSFSPSRPPTLCQSHQREQEKNQLNQAYRQSILETHEVNGKVSRENWKNGTQNAGAGHAARSAPYWAKHSNAPKKNKIDDRYRSRKADDSEAAYPDTFVNPRNDDSYDCPKSVADKEGQGCFQYVHLSYRALTEPISKR